MVLGWLVAILAFSVAAFGGWVAFQLVRQNGRILLRLESIERQLANRSEPSIAAPPRQPNSGLSMGAEAPAFELADLQGRRHSLADYRGRRALFVFFDPACGFCAQLATDLGALRVDGRNGAPLPVVISAGEATAIHRLVDEHGIRCPVLRDPQRAAAIAYQAPGTPVGYLIDERGRIASELAIGADALLALMSVPGLAVVNGKAAPAGGHHGKLAGSRPLTESRITRDGLTAGTPAPAFRLPGLGGSEIALEDYRGRRVLLVFSDPQCGPCMELAPELDRAARRDADPQVLIVSRGDADANRAKVAQQGISLPVALQKQWEVSRAYGMFATPIGYLIDESGVIAADVAVGKDSILALHSNAARGSGARIR